MSDLIDYLETPTATVLTTGSGEQVLLTTVDVLQLLESGTQGPPGPPGPKGDPGVGVGGAYRYEHLQGTAATVWTVNHNLGSKPNTQVLSTGGLTLLAEVLHTSNNQVLVYFDQPTAGIVICS